MDGSLFTRGRKTPDPSPEQEAAAYKAGQKNWNERLKDKDRQIRFGRGVSYAALMMLAASGAGNVYLGTMPKQTVEYIAVEPAVFRPMFTFSSKDMKSIDPVAFRRARIVDFLVNLYSVRPDQKGLKTNLVSASQMVLENSPAWEQGKRYVEETQVYERAKKEAVYVHVGDLTPVSPDTWHATFRKEITDLRGNPIREEIYSGTVETKAATGDAYPSGFGIFSQSFERVAK